MRFSWKRETSRYLLNKELTMINQVKKACRWMVCTTSAWIQDRAGANMAEYAVIAVVIAAALYGVFSALGGRIGSAVNAVLP